MNIQLKVIILGDSGVGKTAFVKRLSTGKFISYYSPTIGAELTTVSVESNIGDIVFDLWEFSGYQKYSRITDKFWSEVHGCLVMFDSNDQNSYEGLVNWINRIKRVDAAIPFVICATKGDHNTVTNRLSYLRISSKFFYNCELALILLARKIHKNSNIFQKRTSSEESVPFFRQSIEDDVELFIRSILGNHPYSDRRNALIRSIRTIFPK
jgi:GTP-binding nuclear protein Ran